MAGTDGETASSSCSWGANRLGWNGMCHHVHQEGLDGTADGNEAWRTIERRKQPCVRLTTFETGSCSSGGVWRTTKRRKRTSYGRNGGPIDREGCGVPQNGTPRDTIHLHRRPPPASTAYCSSTVDVLQLPPVTVHPRAPVHPASTARYSTGYCSTSPLHEVLFSHPSMGYCSSSPPLATVQPFLHGVLFI